MEMRNLQIDGIEIVPIRGIFEALKELKAAEHIPGEF
jgi:hypothetical protein